MLKKECWGETSLPNIKDSVFRLLHDDVSLGKPLLPTENKYASFDCFLRQF